MRLAESARLFTVLRIPVHADWTTLLALPLAWLLTRSVLEAMIAVPAYFGLILVHELGHALVARRWNGWVYEIHLSLLHGYCRCDAPGTEGGRIALAWGGVAAQAVLFVAALALSKALVFAGGIPWPLRPVFSVWIATNLLTAIFNLLPVPPLDGEKAWRVLPYAFRALRQRWRHVRPARPRRPAEPPMPADRVVEMELHRIKRKVGRR